MIIHTHTPKHIRNDVRSYVHACRDGTWRAELIRAGSVIAQQCGLATQGHAMLAASFMAQEKRLKDVPIYSPYGATRTPKQGGARIYVPPKPNTQTRPATTH